MTLPADLKIFSFIYECRIFVLLPVIVLWGVGGFYLLCRLKKLFFLWLLIFPLVLSPLQIAFVYCGWHYRMELRERFARTDRGYRDSFMSRAVNINLMPPEIRAEYGKHNYRPRFRDMKALAVGTIVLTPLLYVLGGATFVGIFLGKKWINGKTKVEKQGLNT